MRWDGADVFPGVEARSAAASEGSDPPQTSQRLWVFSSTSQRLWVFCFFFLPGVLGGEAEVGRAMCADCGCGPTNPAGSRGKS